MPGRPRHPYNSLRAAQAPGCLGPAGVTIGQIDDETPPRIKDSVGPSGGFTAQGKRDTRSPRYGKESETTSPRLSGRSEQMSVSSTGKGSFTLRRPTGKKNRVVLQVTREEEALQGRDGKSSARPAPEPSRPPLPDDRQAAVFLQRPELRAAVAIRRRSRLPLLAEGDPLPTVRRPAPAQVPPVAPLGRGEGQTQARPSLTSRRRCSPSRPLFRGPFQKAHPASGTCFGSMHCRPQSSFSPTARSGDLSAVDRASCGRPVNFPTDQEA